MLKQLNAHAMQAGPQSPGVIELEQRKRKPFVLGPAVEFDKTSNPSGLSDVWERFSPKQMLGSEVK